MAAATTATKSRVKQPKPGWRTTEFWVMIVGSAGAVAAAAAGVLPPKYSAALMTISAVAYKLSRGLAKV